MSWDDIGGQKALKQALTEAVQWPLHHPEAFERMGIRPPKGVLLYGPPGCSKTLAAKALASEARTNFLAVKASLSPECPRPSAPALPSRLPSRVPFRLPELTRGPCPRSQGPELFSKWVGESERAVATLFRKARAAAPSIIFFDEIDALAAKRAESGGGGGVSARVLAQLLHEMDGVQPLVAVLVVAATNRPDLVDPALLRPGRFDTLLHVGLPDEDGRTQILRIHTRKTPLEADVEHAALAARTEGYSGAELAALCREAALAALEEDDDAAAVGARHFDHALTILTPRTPVETLAFFADYEAQQRRANTLGPAPEDEDEGDAPHDQEDETTATSTTFDFSGVKQGEARFVF